MSVGERCFFFFNTDRNGSWTKRFFFLRHNVIPSQIGKYGSECGKYGKMTSLPS